MHLVNKLIFHFIPVSTSRQGGTRGLHADQINLTWYFLVALSLLVAKIKFYSSKLIPTISDPIPTKRNLDLIVGKS